MDIERTRRPLSKAARSYLSGLRAAGYTGPILKTTARLNPQSHPRTYALDDRVKLTPVRSPGVICEAYSNVAVTAIKFEQKREQFELAQPTDDPLLLELRTTYVGKFITVEVQVPGRRKFEFITYKVVDVQHGSMRGGDYYEATCAKAVRNDDGCWVISPDQYLRQNGEVILNRSVLEGHYLVKMIDPDNHEHYDDVDRCMQAFQDREALRISRSTSTSTDTATPASAGAASGAAPVAASVSKTRKRI
jgi:hypothetical protein